MARPEATPSSPATTPAHTAAESLVFTRPAAPQAPAAPPSVASAAPSTVPRTQREAPDSAPALADLPAEQRRDIPPVAISAHFYSPQRERSLVSINGRSLHEGDEVAPDLKLEQITPRGVVLNYKGQRFQLAATTFRP
jgi:general secretion pathway protein B